MFDLVERHKSKNGCLYMPESDLSTLKSLRPKIYVKKCFGFVKECGNAVIPSYIPLVEKNKNKGRRQ